MKLRKLKLGMLAFAMSAMVLNTAPVSAYAEEAVDTEAAELEGETASGDEAVSGDSVSGDTASSEGEVTMSGLTAENGMSIAATFPESYVPVGFHKSSCTYQGQNIEIAYMDNGNGEVVLAYLAQADGSGGDFYLCDINTAVMSDFVQIAGGDGKYIIVLDPGDMIVPPSGFTKAKLQWYGKTVSAWIVADAQGAADENSSEAGTDTSAADNQSYASALFEACAGAGKTLTVYAAEASSEDVDAALAATADTAEDGSGVVEASPSDYFLVYGINQDGVISFYMYDTVENTYQRYVAVAGTDSATTEQYRSSAQKRLFVIAALAVVLVICLFIMINLFIKLRENGGHYRDDEDEDEEDDDDEMEQMRQRVVRKEQSHIRTGRKELNYLMDRDDEDEEDEDEDDEEDEEDDEEEEIVYTKKRRTVPVKEEEDDIDWENMEIALPAHKKAQTAARTSSKQAPVRKTKPAAETVKKRPVRPEEEVRKRSPKPSAAAEKQPSAAPKKRPPKQNLDEDFEFEFLDL